MKDDNRVLKMVYTFFLGILLALFVGVGINTFYEPPKAPEYPLELNMLQGKEPTQSERAAERAFQISEKAYQEKMKPYNRNVSIMTLVAAISFLAISLAFEKRIKVIADGVMLGGLFTLLYSIGRGFASENSKYVFVMITVGLVVVLLLGYHRFVAPHQKKPNNSKIQ